MTNAEKLQQICNKLNTTKDKKKWNEFCKEFDKLTASAPKGLIPFYNWLRKTVDNV